jgi:hypothetical protein
MQAYCIDKGENEMNEEIDYTDGDWYLVPMGVFCQILIDSGRDPAVLFSVVKDEKPDAGGHFIRDLAVRVLPDGYIGMAAKGAKGVHKVIQQMLEKGVIT